MVWVNWEIFTRRWLKRAERRRDVAVDDGDRFISLWIAFNGWMKGRFGEDKRDTCLIEGVKGLSDFEAVFRDLKQSNHDFSQALRELERYVVADMRYPADADRVWQYDGTFPSLIGLIYQIRCNLFHGRKEINEDKKDFDLVCLAYRILLPLFKAYLRECGRR